MKRHKTCGYWSLAIIAGLCLTLAAPRADALDGNARQVLDIAREYDLNPRPYFLQAGTHIRAFIMQWQRVYLKAGSGDADRGAGEVGVKRHSVSDGLRSNAVIPSATWRTGFTPVFQAQR